MATGNPAVAPSLVRGMNVMLLFSEFGISSSGPHFPIFLEVRMEYALQDTGLAQLPIRKASLVIILPAQVLIALTQPLIDTGHVIIRHCCVIIPHPAVIIEPASALIATPKFSFLDFAGALDEMCNCSLN
ncbi:hypothetical protein [Sporosarcina sp.]|uniref:hypothetical protein n=1 Tax=Sporosarcina sp. TaxID=49982 RepID=UPI00260AECEC|nr:hypothetical protein [Sporosarcina sp.]